MLALDSPSQNVKFRDSLLFVVGTCLAKFPKMFDLSSGKGRFPHKLNCEEWLNKDHYLEKGRRFPAQEYFEPGLMKKKDKKEFLEWWEAEDAPLCCQPLPHLLCQGAALQLLPPGRRRTSPRFFSPPSFFTHLSIVLLRMFCDWQGLKSSWGRWRRSTWDWMCWGA